MISNGYILLSRELADSEIWQKPPYYLKIWVHLLLKANHAESRKGKRLGRGQCHVTLAELRKAVSYKRGYATLRPSIRQIWKAMAWLRENRMTVTTKVTRGLVVKICNYNRYQTPGNYEGHNEGPTGVTGETRTVRTREGGSAHPTEPKTPATSRSPAEREQAKAGGDAAGSEQPRRQETPHDRLMGIARQQHRERVPGRPFPDKRWGRVISELLAGPKVDEIDVGQALAKFFAKPQPNGYQPHFFQADFGAGAFRDTAQAADTAQDRASGETLDEIGRHMGTEAKPSKARTRERQVG